MFKFRLIEKPVVSDATFLFSLEEGWTTSTESLLLLVTREECLDIGVFSVESIVSLNLCVLSVLSKGLAREERFIIGEEEDWIDELDPSLGF